MENEKDKAVYEYLRASGLSISKEAIRSISEYLVLLEQQKEENRFLNAITATIQENLKALIPLINLINITQPAQSEPPPKQETLKAEDNMMDFLDNF
jgi:hypothetical protein